MLTKTVSPTRYWCKKPKANRCIKVHRCKTSVFLKENRLSACTQFESLVLILQKIAIKSSLLFSDDGRVSGLMSVNIEPSFYKGQDCLFVNISTGFDRNGGPNPSQNLCQVSGFVNKDLETLEERRLISSKAREAVEASSTCTS